MEACGSPQWFIPTVLGAAAVPEQPRLLGLYIGIVLALLVRSGFPALEMGELCGDRAWGPSPAAKGELLFDGTFGESAWKRLLTNKRFPEAVPWTWGTGTGRCSLGVPLPPPRWVQGCRAALALRELRQAHTQGGPTLECSLPIVPSLGPAPAASQVPAQPPVPPLGAQFWDVRRVLCQGLCQTPQLQGTASAGPGAPSLPQHPGTTQGPPRTLQGPSSASFHPTSAPREKRHQRQSHGPWATSAPTLATPPGPPPLLPGPSPLPPGTLRGKLPALLCLWICTSRFPCPGADVPRRTNPGQVLGWDQHFCTRVPPERSDGIGMDGKELQAWEISLAMRWQYCM